MRLTRHKPGNRVGRSVFRSDWGKLQSRVASDDGALLDPMRASPNLSSRVSPLLGGPAGRRHSSFCFWPSRGARPWKPSKLSRKGDTRQVSGEFEAFDFPTFRLKRLRNLMYPSWCTQQHLFAPSYHAIVSGSSIDILPRDLCDLTALSWSGRLPTSCNG